MAKFNPDPKFADVDAQREAERERLLRELGLHELTYEACARLLFGDLLGPAPGPSPNEPTRVVQAGRPRRS